jgi:hypothetical protein
MNSWRPRTADAENRERMNAMADDFYEEDEDVEDVLAAFLEGPHGLTEGSTSPSALHERIVSDTIAGWSETETVDLIFEISFGDPPVNENATSAHGTMVEAPLSV